MVIFMFRRISLNLIEANPNMRNMYSKWFAFNALALAHLSNCPCIVATYLKNLKTSCDHRFYT